MDPIVRRIERALAAPDLAARLAALPGSDLQSLLLAVMRARAGAVTAPELTAAAARGGTVAPSSVDARRFHALDGAAFAAADGFEAVELAPVAPLGIDSFFGRINANNVMATIRGSQLIADPTTALALDAAARRRRHTEAKLCASTRVTRLQAIPPEARDFTPHFRLFSMVSAGRSEGSFAFELRSLREHLAVYLRLIDALPAIGVDVRAVEIRVSDTHAVRALLAAAGVAPETLAGLVHGYDDDAGAPTLAAHGLSLPGELEPARDLAIAGASAARRRLEGVAAEVFAPLAAAHPHARLRLDGARLAGLGYYDGLTIQIWLTAADGASFPVGDGGFTMWTQTLLGDRKERLLTSGLGLELLAKRFAVRK